MDTPFGHGRATELEPFKDAEAAAARIAAIYERSAGAIRTAFADLRAGRAVDREALAAARYPYVGLSVGVADLNIDARVSFGALLDPGAYGIALTRPDIFRGYYVGQLRRLIEHHRVPVHVGLSDRAIPLPFVVEDSTADITEAELSALQQHFALPDLRLTDNAIANGTFRPAPGEARPLALFGAERVDYSLHRLSHYTGTSARHFQRFILLTNYQRYVEEFRSHGRALVSAGSYKALVEPGDRIFTASGVSTGDAPRHLPQMPAYHLVGGEHQGITLVNIGVGPSNAKTITDHLAVLRPHCWVMLGHCAGLRRSQYLGDYVLAHGYVRDDHVLDRDLPPWVPVPPIAEVQVALQDAVAKITGLDGMEMKTRMRTGTIATVDDRNWELRYSELYERLNQSRAIAVDMESATVAGNGYRFRVPYGTLLCVSDKPLHGEIKLRSMANVMYQQRVSQHLQIGIAAMEILREAGVGRLHSRKLRSFDEPAFR